MVPFPPGHYIPLHTVESSHLFPSSLQIDRPSLQSGEILTALTVSVAQETVSSVPRSILSHRDLPCDISALFKIVGEWGQGRRPGPAGHVFGICLQNRAGLSTQARGNKMWLSGFGDSKFSFKYYLVAFECWKTPRFTPGMDEPRAGGMSFLEASQPPGFIRCYWLRV